MDFGSQKKIVDLVSRLSGVIIPVAMTICGLIVVGLERDAGPEVMVYYILSAVWIVVGILNLSKTLADIKKSHKLLFYHFMLMYVAIFVVGLEPPVILAWLMIFAETVVVMGNKVGMISVGLLLPTFLISLPLGKYDDIKTISMLVFFIMAVFISYAAYRLINVYLRAQESLDNVRFQERLQAEKVTALINNLSVAIVGVDKSGMVNMYNAATLSLLDTNDGQSGRHINDVLKFVDDEDKAVDVYALLRDLTSVVTRDDLIYKLDYEDAFKIEMTMLPIKSAYTYGKSSDVNGYVVMLRDITTEKSLDEERDEFISITSHELRTPVTIMEGSIGNLQYMIEKNMMDADAFKSALEESHEQVLYLAGLLNDLSTLSKAERGADAEAEVIEVRTLMEGVYNKYTAEAQEKGLALNLDLGSINASVNTSKLYLEEIIQDFVTNAIKYTNNGSITLSAIERGENVKFSVADTGIGIGKSDQAKIFEKFYRSEDYRTRTTGGTGLGLYVALKLAKVLGTEIELESRLNHGSTFSIELPIHRESDDKKEGDKK